MREKESPDDWQVDQAEHTPFAATHVRPEVWGDTYVRAAPGEAVMPAPQGSMLAFQRVGLH